MTDEEFLATVRHVCETGGAANADWMGRLLLLLDATTRRAEAAEGIAADIYYDLMAKDSYAAGRLDGDNALVQAVLGQLEREQSAGPTVVAQLVERAMDKVRECGMITSPNLAPAALVHRCVKLEACLRGLVFLWRNPPGVNQVWEQAMADAERLLGGTT